MRPEIVDQIKGVLSSVQPRFWYLLLGVGLGAVVSSYTLCKPQTLIQTKVVYHQVESEEKSEVRTEKSKIQIVEHVVTKPNGEKIEDRTITGEEAKAEEEKEILKRDTTETVTQTISESRPLLNEVSVSSKLGKGSLGPFELSYTRWVFSEIGLSLSVDRDRDVLGGVSFRW